MADGKCVKSPQGSLLNYFQSKPTKLESVKKANKSKAKDDNDNNNDADICTVESKKRKKKRDSLSSKCKKVKLSEVSEVVDVDSGISLQGNSQSTEIESCEKLEGGDVCEVSYEVLLEGETKASQNDLNELDDSVALLDSDEVGKNNEDRAKLDQNRSNLLSFFSPKNRKPLKNVCKNESNDVKITVLSETINEKDILSKSSGKLKKKTQMTFAVSDQRMKLEVQETKDSSQGIDEADDEAICIVSPTPEITKKKKSKKKKHRAISDDRENLRSEGNCGEISYDDFTTETTEKPRRSFLDVMAEASQQASETPATVESDGNQAKKKKKTVKKSRKRSEHEISISSEDEPPAPSSLRRSSRRRATPLKTYDELEPEYSSEFVDSGKSQSPWTLRIRRTKSHETTEKANNTTTQLAQQILKKAKKRNKRGKISNEVVPCKKKNASVDKEISKKELAKSKKRTKKYDNDKDLETIEHPTKSTKMAAIFQTKKKMTKAERKALEEEKARREAFLRGGIPVELRMQVAQSIQASDMIGIHQPFPSAGQSHIGWSQSSYEDVDQYIARKKLKVRTPKILTSTITMFESGRLSDPCSGRERKHRFKSIPKALSPESVDSILALLKSEYPSFPVNKMYDSLQRRKKCVSEKVENTESCERQEPDVIALSDDEIKPGKKKKLKRRKSSGKEKKKDKNGVKVEDNKLNVISAESNNSDITLADLYAPTSSSELIGNQKVKKRLHSWLLEWKEKVDREERLMKKLLERQLKKSKKLSKTEFDDDDDSDFRLSDDELSTGSTLSNTMLLSGSHGHGKTCMVYALAQELGYKVFEVSASNKRSGKIILTQLQEATQSQHVSKSTNSPCKTDKKNVFFSSVPKKSEVDAIKTLSMLQNRQSSCLSLILFDEVDIVFDEDKGFWQAIDSFMRNTKKPMIMTTSDRNFRQYFEYPVEEMVFKMPKMSDVCCYLQLVCLAECFFAKTDEVNDLACAYGLDIRKCLNALQFWMQSGGSAEQDSVVMVSQKTKSSKMQEATATNDDDSGDDFQLKPSSKKSLSGDNDSTINSLDGEEFTITRHLNLLQTMLGLSSDSVHFLSGRDVESRDLNSVFTDGDFTDLIYANSRRSLPLAKDVTPVGYPVFVRDKTKNKQRKETQDLYDDEKSNDKTEAGVETPVVSETEFDVDSKVNKVNELKALNHLSKMMDTFSWTDSFLSDQDRSDSELVVCRPGMDDSESFVTFSTLEATRHEMSTYARLLSLNSCRNSLRQLKDLSPIRSQPCDSLIRLKADYVPDLKTEFDLRRCRRNVSEELEPMVALQTVAVATDYVPTLRDIVKKEMVKQLTGTKRRFFFHYLDNVSLHLTPSSMEMLSTALCQ